MKFPEIGDVVLYAIGDGFSDIELKPSIITKVHSSHIVDLLILWGEENFKKLKEVSIGYSSNTWRLKNGDRDHVLR